MIIGVEARIPRVDPQLQTGHPQEGNNCSVMVAQGIIRRATGQKPTINRLRSIVGQATGGLTMAQAREMYLAYGLVIRAVRLATDVREALSDPSIACHLAVQYGWINANAPRLSGDKGFTGNHSICVYGAEQVLQGGSGPLWVLDGDPLHDARRSAIPKGPVMARWSDLAAAAEAMPSGFQAILVRLP